MTKYVFQESIFAADDTVSIAPFAQLTVTESATGDAAELWEDAEGLEPISGNVVLADEFGFVRFYVSMGMYDVEILSGGETRTLVDLDIGGSAAAQSAAAASAASAAAALLSEQAADASADAASASASASAASAVESESHATTAEGYKDQAELARDAAVTNANIYATESAGRAAVADNESFLVQGSGDIAAYIYRRVNSGSSTLLTTLAATAATTRALENAANAPEYTADIYASDTGRTSERTTSSGTPATWTYGSSAVTSANTGASVGSILTTRFTPSAGVTRYRTTATVNSMSGTVRIGLAVGPLGSANATRRNYHVVSSGVISRANDAFSSVTGLTSTIAGLVFTAGSVLGFELLIDGTSRKGVIRVTGPAGEKVEVPIDSIPSGYLQLLVYGVCNVTWSPVIAEGYNIGVSDMLDSKSLAIPDAIDLTAIELPDVATSSTTTNVKVYATSGGIRYVIGSNSSFISQPVLSRVRESLSLTLTANIVAITSQMRIGFSVGEGTARKLYAYNYLGEIQQYDYAGGNAVTLQAASAARAYTTGDDVSVRLEIGPNGNGRLVAIDQTGGEHYATLVGIPDGPVSLLGRMSSGEALFTALTAEAYTDPGITLPVGMLITAANWPGFTMRRAGRLIEHDFDIDSRRPFVAADADEVVYVDCNAADDTGAGTTSSPKQRLYTAVHGKSGAILVRARPGNYFGALSFNGADTSAITALIIEPWGQGRIIASQHITDTITWSATAGRVNVYQASLGLTAGAVIDQSVTVAHPHARGIDPGFSEYNESYQALLSVASVAACEATAGTFYVSGSTVYVHTPDNRAPDADIRVMSATADNLVWTGASKTLWMQDVDLQGGESALYQDGSSLAAQATIYAKRCSFKYSATNAVATDAAITAYFVDCCAAMSVSDGFNYHAGTGTVYRYHITEINCQGRYNGWNAAGSNNGSTMHNAGVILRINGDYSDNQNRNIHDINSSHTWMLGCVSARARTAGNSYSYRAGTGSAGTDASLMWLDSCESAMSDVDLDTDDISSIKTYALVYDGYVESGSTVSTYTPSDL